MGVVFPLSPALDDTVVDDETGAIWVWDGVKWTRGADDAPMFASTRLTANFPLTTGNTPYDILSLALGPGTWFVTATLTVISTGSAANAMLRLWDGETTFGSAYFYLPASQTMNIVVSGIVTNPAGNVTIRGQTPNATVSVVFNSSGFQNDSSMNAMRVA